MPRGIKKTVYRIATEKMRELDDQKVDIIYESICTFLVEELKLDVGKVTEDSTGIPEDIKELADRLLDNGRWIYETER